MNAFAELTVSGRRINWTASIRSDNGFSVQFECQYMYGDIFFVCNSATAAINLDLFFIRFIFRLHFIDLNIHKNTQIN